MSVGKLAHRPHIFGFLEDPCFGKKCFSPQQNDIFSPCMSAMFKIVIVFLYRSYDLVVLC